MAKRNRVTYRQENGDDGYCYCVRLDGRALTYDSLTRTEAQHFKARVEGELRIKGQSAQH